MGFEPMRPSRATGSQGLLVAERDNLSVVDIPSLLTDFREFCEVDLQLSGLTVRGHVRQIKRFLKHVKKFAHEDIRSFLAEFKDRSPNTYANVLKSLRVFFRDFLGRPDLVKSFRFPHREPNFKVVPSKSELQQFYEALKSVRDKALFLVYASTGLRASEVLRLKLNDVDFQNRMVKPENSSSRTKRTWVSFFNCEADEILRQYLANRDNDDERLFPISRRWLERTFQNTSKRSGIQITPQMLREWFCSEMALKGVSDSYIDAFCGRTPRSILARHYLDYSPTKLKKIYDKADLKVLQ